MIGGGRTGRKPTDGPGAGGFARRADAAILGGVLLAGVAACAAVAATRRAELSAGGRVDPADAVHRVDPTTAGREELRLLPGVGPRLAERIAAEREAHGPYDGLEDLERRVPGVGPARTRWWRERVGEAGPRPAAGEGSR